MMKKLTIVICTIFNTQLLNAQIIDKDGVLRVEKDTFDLKHNLNLAAKSQIYFE